MEGKEEDTFKCDWVGQVFHNSFISKKNGVALLVLKKLALAVLNLNNNDQGRMINRPPLMK